MVKDRYFDKIKKVIDNLHNTITEDIDLEEVQFLKAKVQQLDDIATEISLISDWIEHGIEFLSKEDCFKKPVSSNDEE